MEKEKPKKEWPWWPLAEEDIDEAVKRLGHKPEEFTKERYEEISKAFRLGFEWANEGWREILDDAVKNIMEVMDDEAASALGD